MIQAFGAYIKTITAFMIFSVFVEMLVPDGNSKKYVAMVLGFLMVITVLSPLLSLIDGSYHFTMKNELAVDSTDVITSEEVAAFVDENSVSGEGSNNIKQVEKVEKVEKVETFQTMQTVKIRMRGDKDE